MANRLMSEFWSGAGGAPWIANPEKYDTMLGDLGRLALDAAGLEPGERVLDVGCGSGDLSRTAARRVGPSGQVVGVDVSAPLIRVAESAADRPEQTRYAVADAQVDPLPGQPFDVVVSRFGVMFFEDPVAAFRHLRGSVHAHGRLAFVAWQAASANEWVATALAALVPQVGPTSLTPPGAPGPFSFAEKPFVRELLTSAGWSDVDIRPVGTTVLVGGGGGPAEAASFYGRMLLGDVDGPSRAAATAALCDALAARATDEGLRLGAAVWVVTARNGAARSAHRLGGRPR